MFTTRPASTQLLAVISIKRPIVDQLTNFPLYRLTNMQIFGGVGSNDRDDHDGGRRRFYGRLECDRSGRLG